MEQWLEIGDMQIEDEEYDNINIGDIKMDQLSSEAEDRIKESVTP